MGIKIVADSCCDITPELKENMNVTIVPLTIRVGEKEFIDDETLSIGELLENMKASADAPKTSCPSPKDFMKAYEGEEDGVFVVTLSSNLSGTYNSAVLAKDMLSEGTEKKFVHVFDSLSACIGETMISMKIFELAKINLSNMQIVEKVNNYIKEMKTFFLLESLDNLIKAGRVNKLKGVLASLLNIKPIMGAEVDGTIKLVESVRGSKQAFRRFVEVIGEQGEKLEEKIIGIAHCNCRERAEKFKEELLKRYRFKDIIIIEMAGISTVYANDGGLVVAF